MRRVVVVVVVTMMMVRMAPWLVWLAPVVWLVSMAHQAHHWYRRLVRVCFRHRLCRLCWRRPSHLRSSSSYLLVKKGHGVRR